jgi:hypothetical protein
MSSYPGELGRREKGYIPLVFPNRKQHDYFCRLTGAGHRWYHGGQGAILANGKIYCTVAERNHEALSYAIRCGARVPPDAWLVPPNPNTTADVESC